MISLPKPCHRWLSGLTLLLAVCAPICGGPPAPADHDWQVPDRRVMLPFDMEQPIYFVAGDPSVAEWNKLPAFWNEGTEEAAEPMTGRMVTRKVVRIKVPLGLPAPPVPAENPLTVARWSLGKELFFDPVLSSDGTVSCASCHDPRTGFATPTRVSTGIQKRQGAFNAPSIINVAYHRFLLWDGRAASLEEQAQEPVRNPLEMHDGDGDAWKRAVERVRGKGTYTKRFQAAFGTEPTRDSIAKALAGYERTVLSGNALHDRAVRIARLRGAAPEASGAIAPRASDYEAAMLDAVERKDAPALTALMGFNPLTLEVNRKEIRLFAEFVASGRKTFFGRARCHECHSGDRFTDDSFHNLGLSVQDGKLLPGHEGRFASLPIGRKDPALMGAFKTPTLRGLLHTGPYMHDGSLESLEKVVEFYSHGGQANEFLDIRRRDLETERDLLHSVAQGLQPLPRDLLFGKDQKLVVPLRLPLGDRLQMELVLFLRALQGDPVDPLIADPKMMPR